VSFAKRASYQITHFLVNLVLSITGLYLYYTVAKHSHHDTKIKVTGWEVEFAILCQIQLAYNLWALPAGIFYMQERNEMIGHHISVIGMSIISGFFTNGFRYYAPFFFGVIETSSVPLSIMNIFKSNHELSQKFPITSLAVTLVFASTFLYVRVYLWMPLMYDFLCVCFKMGVSHLTAHGQDKTHKMISIAPFIVAFAGGVFLTLLQLLWAYKVVKGLVRLTKGKEAKTTKEA
jgi:hypothetical protein